MPGVGLTKNVLRRLAPTFRAIATKSEVVPSTVLGLAPPSLSVATTKSLASDNADIRILAALRMVSLVLRFPAKKE